MLQPRFILLFLMIMAALSLAGCRKPAPSEPEIVTASPEADGVLAKDILAGMQNAYAQTGYYSDEAYLYLSYRMQGSLIQEQQPWKTRFQRPNRLAGDWYNSRIRCDGNRLGCFVFDNDTANLDNQWLVLEADGRVPLDRLLADPMARPFVAGESEIPLDTSVPGGSMPLIPAVAGLLTGDQPWPVLQTPDSLTRLDDALVDERPCYHLQLRAKEVTVECWIDRETFLLRQMTLPVELLEENVRNSPEISELRFFARMHKCSVLPAGSADSLAAFELTAPGGAKPVRHLIALPEEFPCEFVGKPAPALNFQAGDGSRNVLVPEGNKIQVLIWLPAIIDPMTAENVAAMIAESGNTDVRYVLNAEHLQPLPDRLMMYPEIAKCLSTLSDRSRILIDRGLENLLKTKMKHAAAAMVIDPDRVVQYATSLYDGQWQQKLSAVIARTGAGDSVGQEMQADYARYLETYHRRLEMVAVKDLAGPAAAMSEDSGQYFMTAKQVWSCDQVQKPGNLVIATDGSVVAIDGWRSIVRIDDNGAVLESRKLEMPPGSSISRIRQLKNGDKTVWAAFSVMGQAVFLFDQDWNPAGTVAGTSREMDRVLDCRFGIDGTGEPVLLVAFESSGVRQFKPDGTADGTVSDQRCELIGTAGDQVLGLQGGKVQSVSAGATPMAEGNQIVTSFRGLPAGGTGVSPTDNAIAISVGMNATQIWTATLLYQESRVGLEGLAGPQLFDTQIEPLVCLQSRGMTCSADSTGQVRVYDRSMKTVCRFTVPENNGLAIFESGGSVMICCSSAGRIIAWRLEENGAKSTGAGTE